MWRVHKVQQFTNIYLNLNWVVLFQLKETCMRNRKAAEFIAQNMSTFNNSFITMLVDINDLHFFIHLERVHMVFEILVLAHESTYCKLEKVIERQSQRDRDINRDRYYKHAVHRDILCIYSLWEKAGDTNECAIQFTQTGKAVQLTEGVVQDRCISNLCFTTIRKYSSTFYVGMGWVRNGVLYLRYRSNFVITEEEC